MNALDQIRQTVLGWEGVTAHQHRFGGVEFRLGKRELGHIHGDWLVDIPFPMNVRNELIASGRVRPHHVLPQSGWISFYVRKDTDVAEAIQLLHRSYDIALKQKVGRS
jgi:predicted DNA-binding protein (MmcQ/YjbR family)